LLVAVYFLPSFLVVAIGKGQLQNRHPKARQLDTLKLDHQANQDAIFELEGKLNRIQDMKMRSKLEG
jgi:hypothetical protein